MWGGPISALVTKIIKKVHLLRADGRDYIKTINGMARHTKPHARARPNATSKASDPRSKLSRRHILANSGIGQTDQPTKDRRWGYLLY
jgi:hypothetical protein